MSRKKILLFLLIPLFISSCDEDSNPVEDIPDLEDAFTFVQITNDQFPAFQTVRVTNRDEIYVTTNTNWFIITNNGTAINPKDSPDSLYFSRIKEFGDSFIGVGVHITVEEIFGVPVQVPNNSLFKSDNGDDWELMLGPFLMFDFVENQNGEIVVARGNGVSLVDMDTFEETRRTIFTGDFIFPVPIEDLATNSQGTLFATSLLGILESKDNGNSWDEVFEGEYLPSLTIDESDRMFAYRDSVVYSSTDLGQTWAQEFYQYENNDESNGDFFHTAIDFSLNDYIYALSADGFYIARKDDQNLFREVNSSFDQNRFAIFDRVRAFSNGNVLITNENQIWLGIKNGNSEFWD